MTIKQVQQALEDAGFDPGPIDGVRGRKTIRAVKAFQAAKGLGVDGIVGRNTARALMGNSATVATKSSIQNETLTIPHTMPWFQEAYNLIGTKEKPGSGSNEAILGWAQAINIDYNKDEIPWCGLFVAHCVASQLPDEPLPNNPLGAQRWKTFGDKCTPQPGAVMVFWRNKPTDWRGHVGFYWGEDSHTYHILGGNQKDSVNIARLKKKRLITARWPETVPGPEGGPRMVSPNGRPITTNEQ